MVRGITPLRRALAACTIFAVVEYAYWTGVLLFAYQEGGAGLAGLAMIVQLVPAAALATPLGRIGDRMPRGTALSLAYAAEAAALAVLAILTYSGAGLPVILASSTVATVIVSVARPIHNAALPLLALSPRSLVQANSFTTAVDGIGVFLGPALVGVLVASTGFVVVPVLCAVAMLAASLLTTRLGISRTLPAFDDGEADDGWLSGLRIVARDVPVLVLLLMAGVSFVVMGATELLAVSYAFEVLDGGEELSGLLIGVEGVGGFVGAIIASVVAIRVRLSPVIAGFLILSGLPLLAMAATTSVGPAILWLTLCGVGLAVSNIAIRTLLQRVTEPATLARIFAVHESLIIIGLALGALLAPIAIDTLGAASAYLPVGVGLIVIAVLALPLIRALDRRPTFDVRAIDLLSGVPFLHHLSPPVLQRLALSAEFVEVPQATAVVVQGEEGDFFYVIERGDLSVSRDGECQDRNLGAGACFGEHALLADAPRTVTLTTITPARLLRISRQDFLAAVTGVADGANLATQIDDAWSTRTWTPGEWWDPHHSRVRT